MAALRGMRYLKVLHLRDCNLDDNCASALGRTLDKLRLVQLILSNNSFSDHLVEVLGTYLNNEEACRSLKLLQVDRNNIYGSNFKDWIRWDAQRNYLETLIMGEGEYDFDSDS
jgi:hypothetical protein